MFSVAVPLTLLAIAGQNAPRVGILQANGYDPPVNAITIYSGVGSVLAAPLLGNGMSVAAPTTAICSNPDADPDPENRYVATVVQGVLFIAFGLLSATAISLVRALPNAPISGLAGLALLPVIVQSLRLSVGSTWHTTSRRGSRCS